MTATVCPRSLVHIYTVGCYIEIDKTSWAYTVCPRSLDPFFTVNLLYKMVQLFYFSTMLFKVAFFVSFRMWYIIYLNQSQLFQKNNHGTHNKW